MNDKNAASELFNTIKTIVDNYMKARKPATVLMGTYNGSAIVIGNLPVPMSLVTGNAKTSLASGDKVRLLRSDGGREYYILEVIGKPYRFASECNQLMEELEARV